MDSGFNHVKPEQYQPRLLQFKGKKKVRIIQVPLVRESLNSGDVFILDAGLMIYQFNGKQSTPFERNRAAQVSRALDDERSGKPQVVVYEEGAKDAKPFWDILGGEGPIMSAAEGGSDEENVKGERALFRLSDNSGQLTFKEEGRGNQVKKSLLDTQDVFIFDNGAEVFAWIGKNASAAEKRSALQYAHEYLKKYNRPLTTPISRVMEGGENEVFEISLC